MRNILILVLFFVAMLSRIAAAQEAASYGGYPAPDAMVAEIRALAVDFPQYAEILEYGASVQGRPLLVVRIAADLGVQKPPALIAAGIHGNEWISNRVAMAAALRLLNGIGSDAWIDGLLARMDFYVIPCINPDGYYRTFDMLADKTIPWRNGRKNANRVDINRNFPLPGKRTLDVAMAGVDDDPDHERYTGPEPYSEPESRAIRDLAAARPFFAAVDLHSNWGTIFPPKCNSKGCEKQFQKMCDAGIARQKHVKYPCVMAYNVDSFSGEMEDMLFYDFGVMAVCWETFTTRAADEQMQRMDHSFWSQNPEDITYWTDNDADAVLAALEASFLVTGGQPIPEKHRQVKE